MIRVEKIGVRAARRCAPGPASVPASVIAHVVIIIFPVAVIVVKEAGVGNLGLQDRKFEPLPTPEKADAISAERTALRWVNKFIPAFGGDPSKVTM